MPHRPRSVPDATSVGCSTRARRPTLGCDEGADRASAAPARGVDPGPRRRPDAAVDARLAGRHRRLRDRRVRRADRLRGRGVQRHVGDASAPRPHRRPDRLPDVVGAPAVAARHGARGAAVRRVLVVGVDRRRGAAVHARRAPAGGGGAGSQRAVGADRADLLRDPPGGRRAAVGEHRGGRARDRGRRHVGHVRARAAPTRAHPARPRRARRGRAAAARRAGAPAGAGADRARDARRARAPDLAAQPACRRARVPPRRAAGGGGARGRDHPQQRPRGAQRPARGDRRAARRAPDGDDPGAPAADARRPARADRRVARGGHARGLRLAARGGRPGPGRHRPQRVPDRAGGAHQRAQARARLRGRRDRRRRARRRPDDRDPQPAAGGRARRPPTSPARAPASSGSPSARAWPAAGSSTAARTRGTTGCGRGCRGRRERADPRADRRRRRARARRPVDDDRRDRRHPRGGRGRRRVGGRRRGRRLRAGRRADGHPDAGGRRPRRHASRCAAARAPAARR